MPSTGPPRPGRALVSSDRPCRASRCRRRCRTDRSPPRRAVRRRARAAPGRGRPREDVHAGRRVGARRRRDRRRRPARPSFARRSSSSGRSALSRARPVRLLQDLVRHVAYETLSKRERRARHLAAADHLSTAFVADEDEVVEVIASHYIAAYEAVPDDEEAAEIREKARAMLVRAGDRAESLAAARRQDATRAGGGADGFSARAGDAPRQGGRDGRADRRSRRGPLARREGNRPVRGGGRQPRCRARSLGPRSDRREHRPP